jgi:hypothetical protein
MYGSDETPNGEETYFKCPYGKPGDRMWVRETWSRSEAENGNELIVYRADNSIADVYQLGDGAKSLNGFLPERWGECNGALKWRPSIHMPRWASRITMEVFAVRVERLQEITDADAESEGVAMCEHFADAKRGHPLQPHKTAFAWMWNKINGRNAWIENPWVWVVEFKSNWRMNNERRSK